LNGPAWPTVARKYLCPMRLHAIAIGDVALFATVRIALADIAVRAHLGLLGK